MDKLNRWYGTQLNLFKNALVEEMFWDPERGNQEYLSRLAFEEHRIVGSR
jgi:hypothetical protein